MNYAVNSKRLTETTGGGLIVGVYNQPEFSGELKELDQAMGGHLTQLAKEGDISSAAKEITVVHTLGQLSVKRIVFVGLGKAKEVVFNDMKEAFGAAAKQIKQMKLTSFAVAIDTFETDEVPAEDVAHAWAE
ncbi:M17 family peptidase N-terminal domain-containing protein, partial [Rossellomorea marisflavi]|uniref:M17 family peptidase N-terminal domain-containing protein n=1 Tax=Rossellomorea marisflavi TaxID=189381 RepID=UPI00295E37FE